MKMKTRKRRVCETVLLLLLTIKHVKTDGKLDIQFISYRSDGKESNGHCCDSSVRAGCLDKCDPMFFLCIDGPDRRRPCSVYKSTTNYIDNHNTINFGDSIQGTPNPFTVHISKAVPSSIEITAEVYDKDDIFSDDHMDTLSKLINIQAAATQQEAVYTHYTVCGRTKLEIDVRAYCDPNWYGSACEKYCKVTPDHSHYTCHNYTGDKFCFEGWKGDNCNQDIDECTESDKTCQHSGTCTNTQGSYECICMEGIKGNLCENIINQCALEPCLNGGACDGNESDFKCACPVEWTGETCADKVNFCDSSPCNMGHCTPDLLTATRFKCDCDFAWVGDKCSQSVGTFNITLLGEIDHTNRGDLADGFNRIITELGGIPGKVDVKFKTNTHIESNYTTTHVQLYSAVENGSFLESSSLDRIFESSPDEVINEYLPLPLYPPREEEEVKAKSPHDSWDTNQYVSTILPPVGLVLMSVLLVVAFCIWRRRSKETEQCRDDNQLCKRNLQPPGAMTENLHEASVSPDGYTSLRFLEEDEGSHDTCCDDTSNIHFATEDMTLDEVIVHCFGVSTDGNARLGDVATLETNCEDTSNRHLATADMTLDEVIVHGFGVSTDGNARLGDVATLETNCEDTSNRHLATADMTLDEVIVHGFGVSTDGNARLGDVATLDTNCEDTSNRHLATEDMTHARVILHGFGVSPDANTSLLDVATLQQVSVDWTLDPVTVEDPRRSPNDNSRHGDEATLHDVPDGTLDTHCHETSNALPTIEDVTLDSVRLQRPDPYDVGRLDARRHVTSYIQPVPGDLTLDPVSLEPEEEDAEYIVIDDNDFEDLLKEDPYETIESLDDNDVEKTRMKR